MDQRATALTRLGILILQPAREADDGHVLAEAGSGTTTSR
jgi:hypothetical protein